MWSLTSSPILRLPDLSRQFILRTDASDIGVGAVLLQQYKGGTFPVAYASKKLLKREQNYSVIERVCLVIVYVVKKFQKYLYGKEFVIQTDQAPLSYIQKCRVESARIMRWSLFLQNYRFHIELIKGSENVGADYLSRQWTVEKIYCDKCGLWTVIKYLTLLSWLQNMYKKIVILWLCFENKTKAFS